MPDIKAVCIFSKPGVPAAGELVPKLLAWLRERGIQIRCDEETASYATNNCHVLPRKDAPEGCDLVIVLGGDGTLLSAARAIRGREIPLFPVNLGGLGFLTAITLDEVFPELERAFRGEHRVGKRKMLEVELSRNGETVARYEALNDAVINKASLARMIDLDAYVDQMFVCAYKVDGLIVATPTGSTAYSLSAGGPIIFPSVAAFCLTPICPHTLTNRPLVVPGDSKVVVVLAGHTSSATLTIDGQSAFPIEQGDRVEVEKAKAPLRLYRSAKSYFEILRDKLRWGVREI